MKRRTRINPVSKRRRKRDREYQRARVAVAERANGICELGHQQHFSGVEVLCGAPMTDVHHIEGRVGPDLHRLDNLLGLCRFHHDLVHANPSWAYAVGAMRSRLATGDVRAEPTETDRTTSGDAA